MLKEIAPFGVKVFWGVGSGSMTSRQGEGREKRKAATSSDLEASSEMDGGAVQGLSKDSA